MTIKRKIRLSNIMMVLIPILFTAMVITVCLHTSLGSYWYTLEAMYSDENSIQFAQSMIYTYQKELWENNWGQDGHADVSEEIKRSDEMNHLESKLSGMGYHFMITKNEKQIYTNLTEEDMQAARSVAGDGIDTARSLTASRNEVSKNKLIRKLMGMTAVIMVSTALLAGCGQEDATDTGDQGSHIADTVESSGIGTDSAIETETESDTEAGSTTENQTSGQVTELEVRFGDNGEPFMMQLEENETAVEENPVLEGWGNKIVQIAQP